MPNDKYTRVEVYGYGENYQEFANNVYLFIQAEATKQGIALSSFTVYVRDCVADGTAKPTEKKDTPLKPVSKTM